MKPSALSLPRSSMLSAILEQRVNFSMLTVMIYMTEVPNCRTFLLLNHVKLFYMNLFLKRSWIKEKEHVVSAPSVARTKKQKDDLQR